MKKKVLDYIDCIFGRINEWYYFKKKEYYMRKYLKSMKGKAAVIIGTPTHKNIGDSAIVLAEKAFLKKCGYLESQIFEITVQEYKEVSKVVNHYIQKNKGCICCWHGGGNLGDQWMSEEIFRRWAMEVLPKNQMIIFPQTIYYTPTEQGEKEKKDSIAYYNGRERLIMIAREMRSYYIMGELYPDTPILLAPDIVLFTTMATFNVTSHQRNGILLCMRTDVEKSMTEQQCRGIELYLQEKGYSYRKTDMYAECQVTKNNREECVRNKMNEFTEAELVITDRLHGMIFAAITGTPCIVFDNYNHKVYGTYEWIKYLSYVKYVEDVEEMTEYIDELLVMKECKFDNGLMKQYFDRMVEVVKENA